MNKHTHTSAHKNDVSSLAEGARNLMDATVDVVGEKVGEARNRLAVALESAQKVATNVRDKAVAGAKATDRAVHKHPYKSLAVAAGVGALIGMVIARRRCRTQAAE